MSFRLFGFPITLQGSFFLVLGLLGYTSFPNQIDRAVAFVAIGVVAVTIHELGHAFAARSKGTVGTPTISMEGMSGLTRYRLKEVPSRATSIFISFAGPLAGLVTGAIVFFIARAEFLERNALNDDLISIALFTTIGWSVLNLLPIVPLDGGHILAELLPGDRHSRTRKAAVISIAVAVVAAIWVWIQFRAFFGVLILGMLVAQNMSLLSSSSKPSIAPVVSVRDE